MDSIKILYFYYRYLFVILRLSKEFIMKKIAIVFLGLLSIIVASSCSIMRGLEENLTISVRAKGDLIFSGVVNSFNNVILPKIDPSYIDKGMKFAGYTIDSDWNVDKGIDLLYKQGGLIRYKDIKKFAYNGNVEFFSQFVTEDTDIAEKHYLVVGWYNKIKTSGLDDKRIEKLTPLLTNFLVSKGATSEDLSDFIIKGYEGDVGTIGGKINEDGYVDVFIGAGANLKSTGGVNYIDRYAADKNYGDATKRYVYLLREKPVARLVYDYFSTDEFYSIFE